jgi:hypothetical protein
MAPTLARSAALWLLALALAAPVAVLAQECEDPGDRL